MPKYRVMLDAPGRASVEVKAPNLGEARIEAQSMAALNGHGPHVPILLIVEVPGEPEIEAPPEFDPVAFWEQWCALAQLVGYGDDADGMLDAMGRDSFSARRTAEYIRQRLDEIER